MSLARAFTTRRAKKQLDISAPSPPVPRTTTPRFAYGTIKRTQISGPTELLSTTNMLSYTAPDLYPTDASKRIASSSTASTHSGEDSDNSRMASSMSLTSTDSLSIDSRSPITPAADAAGDDLSAFSFGTKSIDIPSRDEAPGIPQRAPSHTKRNHEIISRKNSVARMSPPRRVSTSRSSLHMFSANVEESVMEDAAVITAEPYPFSQELAQVTEIAEEYGITKEAFLVDEEEQELISRGLFKFRAEDYMSEIQGLFMNAFGEVKPITGPVWI
ncbi:hypothetical protein DSL72_004493 [Monilinia vaccinii-corymbosi]|uniref:Uncharacterized protein n=1 Tax=Monilinia vaccinii-corymbosi TaxID=61207 RepID=A0A8A3NW90_9HELO|nr:hypothetical protein DSL72_004493 [Monilinia vaccinii-corymbosi]